LRAAADGDRSWRATAVPNGIGMATICAPLPSQVTWPVSRPELAPITLARSTVLVRPVRRSRIASLVESLPVA